MKHLSIKKFSTCIKPKKEKGLAKFFFFLLFDMLSLLFHSHTLLAMGKQQVTP
jgi:hypothetical protein